VGQPLSGFEPTGGATVWCSRVRHPKIQRTTKAYPTRHSRPIVGLERIASGQLVLFALLQNGAMLKMRRF
jgi:hypothetical protein